eukprot:CAMPEP_0198682732 /NCGR_PEP_ID=MMETSP1468-20131203/9348_1 /TAXON_ID=1461545 /ORGANISM="Mantoniella sp, Strain CCMP1436" /LENGTH=52 /DNA_ID=CAMNT_0044426065 /DNA_START=78 /DNA_END=236 /DNA_ORIENTATION=-
MRGGRDAGPEPGGGAYWIQVPKGNYQKRRGRRCWSAGHCAVLPHLRSRGMTI